MKHIEQLLLIFVTLCLLAACQKAPELTVTSPSSIELGVDGSSSTITFTANRDWSVRSSDSWVSVSPTSGTASDEAVTVRVSCSANTTYEDRTATITITMEELSQTVTVKQPANLGIVIPTQSYNLASDARTIEVEVRSNVQYAVSVSDSWIKQTGTKGLVTDKLTFSVEENDTYDARSATITIKPQNATVQEQVITVKQAQKDALIVKDTSFDMPYGGGEIEVKVEANVSFDVKPSEDWIHYVETKALSGSTIRLKVDENPTYSAREGKIEVKQKNGTLSHTLTVKQAGRIAVTSIELNKTSLTLKEGESETLTATVKPDNATDKTVTWATSDPEVAQVDEAGLVSAIIEGTAMITAKAGEKTAECKVAVIKEIPVTSVELDKTVLALKVGESATLTTIIKPDNATDKTVTWTSSDLTIATVDDVGVVMAKAIGTVTITATVGEQTASCKLVVRAADFHVPNGAVDLGLSVLWSTTNFNANVPLEVGAYYLWGDPSNTGRLMHYTAPNVNSVSGTQYDIATHFWGTGWRLPTKLEIEELFSNCSWEKAEESGSSGARLTGPNGQSISIPFSGYALPADGPAGTTTVAEEDKAFILSGESYRDGSGRFAYVFFFDQNLTFDYGSWNTGVVKFPIRPVYDEPSEIVPVSVVSLNKVELYLEEGETATLVASILPDNATDKRVGWKSEDETIATVDGNGNVTAIKEGTTKITVQGGEQTASCKVTVYTVPNGNIEFADSNVKDICVQNWDSNGDGELSFREAMAVTDIYAVFNNKTTIVSFDELQYFTGLSKLKEKAFQNCSSLTSIIIPEGVTSIGSGAFSGCSSLTSLTLPAGIIRIERGTFSGCSGLKGDFVVPEGVTSIGENAFSGCIGLSGVVLPESVSEIGDGAFWNCSGLTGTFVLPNSINTVAGDLFLGCSSLSGISLPSGVTHIGEGAFRNCKELTSIIIPNGVESIGAGAFDSCSKLSSIALPNGITTIEDLTFYGCSNLTSIIIPNRVISLGKNAFGECEKLPSITLPNGLTTIGSNAFYGCSSLTDVAIPEGVAKIENCTFYQCMALKTVSIPSTVKEIGENAFFECKSLMGITLPNGITGIGKSAFQECSGMTGDLFLPASIESIGASAFKGCSKLNGTLTLPASLKSIEKETFYNCHSLTGNLSLPAGITSIGEKAFYECGLLTGDITIPKSVTKLGSYAFFRCKKITGATISANISELEDYLFYECNSLNSVTLPESLTTIGFCVFYGCALESITIPTGVTSILNAAFSHCSGLTTLTIPDSVTTLGMGVFMDCTSLINMTIPFGVTTIDGLFQGCRALTTVVIPEGLTTIGVQTFFGCHAMEEITLPKSLTMIDTNAFGSCDNMKAITILATTPPQVSSKNVFSPVPDILVPAESVDVYKTSTYWTRFAGSIKAISE